VKNHKPQGYTNNEVKHKRTPVKREVIQEKVRQIEEPIDVDEILLETKSEVVLKKKK
jgi:hypothetical protein